MSNAKLARRAIRPLAAIAAVVSMTSPLSAQDTLEEIGIAELQGRYRGGLLSVRAATQWHLDRLLQLDRNGPRLNSVPTINLDALAEADAIDEGQKNGGPLGPLFGVPIVIKDLIHVAGLPTTRGLVSLLDGRATADATVVARLRAAGAIIIGKSSLTGHADNNAESAAFGLTRNPYDFERSALGSSGGSAVAVAASLAVAAIGTETTDSLRAPAAATGLVTIKPSRGLVPGDGIFKFSAALDEVGPMARSVADATAMFAVMAARPDFNDALIPTALAGRRLGVPAYYVGRAGSKSGIRYPLEPRVAVLFAQARRDLKAAGAEVIDVALPLHTYLDLDQIDANLLNLVPPRFVEAEIAMSKASLDSFAASSGLPGVRDFGDFVRLIVRRGVPADAPFFRDYAREVARERANLVINASEQALFATLMRVLDAERQKRISRQMRSRRLDGFVFPTMYRQPLTLAAEVVAEHYGTGVMSYAPNVYGLPAITVPMGRIGSLPASLTFMGDNGDDALIIGYAFAYEQMTRHRFAPPPSPPAPAPTYMGPRFNTVPPR